MYNIREEDKLIISEIDAATNVARSVTCIQSAIRPGLISRLWLKTDENVNLRKGLTLQNLT